jgi:YD repeat-containing protein
VAKPFEALYEETDSSGAPLEWEWDEEERVFTATDDAGRVYTLRPIAGVLDIVEDDVEEEDEDEEE